MINKKKEWARIGIYLLFAFVPPWVIGIILNVTMGFEEWFTGEGTNWIGAVYMAFPAIANVLTRFITKEGWKDSYLHLNLKGNLKYYFTGLLLPVFCGIVSGFVITFLFGKFSPQEITADMSPIRIFSFMLMIFAMAAPLAFYTFGEEFGWRAYLYPKLEKLIGTPAACLAGGAIWGIWHAPLTVEGHNFGTDYWGYPWFGVILMIVLCTSYGTVMMWITKKTGSVYPAAICHAVINNGGMVVGNFFITGVPEDIHIEIYHFLAEFSPFILCGIIFFVMLVINSGKNKTKNMPV